MMVELKPCPFCGVKPNITCVDGLPHNQYYIACENDECPVCSETCWYDSETEAVKAWNTRAEPITLMSPITTVSEGEPQTYVPLRTCENVSEVAYGFRCSICGDWEDIDYPKYCAHCGAKVVKK